ncbi:MAG: class I SAM-dependent methyltransferase [Rhodoferax sp.]|nr:class I SAM-dependent methyltransferase [Rhodoferax sp.]
MNEQRPIAVRISIAADRASAYTNGTVAPVQDLLPALPALQRGVKEASDLLTRLFRGFDGSLALRLWNGTTLSLGNVGHDNLRPPFTLVCRHPSVVRSLVLGRDPLRLAEAYFRGEIDIEGDFFAALGLKDHLHLIRMSTLDRVGVVFSALRLRSPRVASPVVAVAGSPLQGRSVRAHSKTENQGAITFHYDVSNEFYALWLDDAMVYSCAYFEHPGAALEVAQFAKLDHICRKLLLQPGDYLLDIGCGWGALVIHAARHYGVRAHGITLSERQLTLARERIAQAGLEDRVSVELRDYRDLAGESVYDKVSSVGMFEHVGLKNLSLYFATVSRVLKPAGLFLNHGITHDVEGWAKTSSTEFINRYVFPDGQLDTVSNIQRLMETAKFEIGDVEGLRPHYALTLRHWVARLERRHAEALQYVSGSTWRIWHLYMAACALEFESGEIGVYQILASKRAVGSTSMPLTRQHMYPAHARPLVDQFGKPTSSSNGQDRSFWA